MGKKQNLLTELIKKLMADNKRRKIIISLGFILVLLIFVSIFFDGNKKSVTENTVTEDKVITQEEYASDLEERLTDMVKNISGVGRVKVMLTVDGTGENIYQSDVKKTSDISSSDQSMSYEQEVVLIKDNNGQTTALIRSKELPKVTGVVVVCEGGDDIKVQKRVISAVTTVFNISSAKVYVTKLEQ